MERAGLSRCVAFPEERLLREGPTSLIGKVDMKICQVKFLQPVC